MNQHDAYARVPSSSNHIEYVIEGSATLCAFSRDGAGHIITDVRAGSTYALLSLAEMGLMEAEDPSPKERLVGLKPSAKN